MRRSILVWIAVLCVTAAIGMPMFGDEEQALPSLITGVDELLAHPAVQAAESGMLFVVVLPDTARAVLLRPIGEAESASYQVQAIAAEMIEHQMLAAAFVMPVLESSDAAALPIDLARFLMETINRISGFVVFDGVAAPGP